MPPEIFAGGASNSEVIRIPFIFHDVKPCPDSVDTG
jgi:hypothetical protein